MASHMRPMLLAVYKACARIRTDTTTIQPKHKRHLAPSRPTNTTTI